MPIGFDFFKKCAAMVTYAVIIECDYGIGSIHHAVGANLTFSFTHTYFLNFLCVVPTVLNNTQRPEASVINASFNLFFIFL
jgi:hypothetical protein